MGFLSGLGGRLRHAFSGDNLLISRALLGGDYAAAAQLRERQAAQAAQREEAERAGRAAALRAQALAAFGYDKASIAGLAPQDASALLRQRVQASPTPDPDLPGMQGLPRIGNDEEFERLPSGARFVAPDGTIRSKR
jgi:hypothetical protein